MFKKVKQYKVKKVKRAQEQKGKITGSKTSSDARSDWKEYKVELVKKDDQKILKATKVQWSEKKAT